MSKPTPDMPVTGSTRGDEAANMPKGSARVRAIREAHAARQAADVEPASAPNVTTTAAGKVRPVTPTDASRVRKGSKCESCGADVPKDVWGAGWSVAPFPPDYQHNDGTTGDKYVCPNCYAAARGMSATHVQVMLWPWLPALELPREVVEGLTASELEECTDAARHEFARVMRLRMAEGVES